MTKSKLFNISSGETHLHSLEALGFYQGPQKERYDLPRQAEDSVEKGCLVFRSGCGFEQALEGIEGFDRLWVLFQFHQNPHWKPKIQPPRKESGKVGVFATRSPHRPNALGLSCVRLEKREGLKLWIRGADLLDGTPFFDVKPYVPEHDSFPEAQRGWLEEIEKSAWPLSWSRLSETQTQWLSQCNVQIINFIERQLEFDPFNSQKKRVTETSQGWILAYRTWRVKFHHITQEESNQRKIHIDHIESGYLEKDLKDETDPYEDKAIHKEFLKKWPRNSGGLD